MKRLIICEGFDNSGKTTLAHRLANRLQNMDDKHFCTEVMHSPGPLTPEEMADWVDDLTRRCMFEGAEPNILISDRMPMISEAVYGPTLRGVNKLERFEDELWEKILALNPVIIYCRPPSKVILETLGERDQMDGVVSRKAQLIRAYDVWFMQWLRKTQNLLVYDYTIDPSAYEIASDVIWKLQRGAKRR